MVDSHPLRILFISAYCDGTDVGEAFFSFKWAQQLSIRTELTVLSLATSRMRIPLQEQLPNATVVTWREPPGFRRLERINAMLKPAYADFYFKVRAYLRDVIARRERFDIVHQMGPNSLRYPCPAVGFGIPVVHGPMQGSVPTPAGFKSELTTAAWYTRLRELDRFRLKYDPWLRHSFSNVDMLLVGAPYVLKLLEDVPLKRTEVICHLGIEGLVEHPEKTNKAGRLRLVHVARAVRTKGLRDCVKALAQIPDLSGVTLDVAGEGEETPVCKALAETLGVSHRITFHGRLPREKIEGLYSEADAMLFPSFREPQGGVVLEAMRHGLPVIMVDQGGPGYLVTERSGFRLKAASPTQLASDIATTLRQIVETPEQLRLLSAGAYERALELGSWERKMDTLIDWYSQLRSFRQTR